jgi:hypothetical protein
MADFSANFLTWLIPFSSPAVQFTLKWYFYRKQYTNFQYNLYQSDCEKQQLYRQLKLGFEILTIPALYLQAAKSTNKDFDQRVQFMQWHRSLPLHIKNKCAHLHVHSLNKEMLRQSDMILIVTKLSIPKMDQVSQPLLGIRVPITFANRHVERSLAQKRL